jgi:hypothetical protein
MASQSQKLPDPAPLPADRLRSGAANLGFFVQDRVAPVLNRIGSKGMDDSSYSQAFVRGELLESFLWLHHGVEIGYFPVSLSRRVTYEYFPLFLKAYESVRSESYFETWFTVPLRAIFEGEFAGKQELFSAGRIWESSKAPAGAEALLQPCFILANGFVQNPRVRLLMQAVAMMGDSEWDGAISNKLEIEEDEETVSDETSERSMYAGFFSLLEYMRAFRTMKADFGERFDDPASQDYLRLIKETQQWRMNFGYAKYRERFMQLARIAADTFSKQLAVSEQAHAAWAVADFLQSFYDLTTDWGTPLTQSAGA